MKKISDLSIGNKIALFSLVVAIATLLFGIYQSLDDGEKNDHQKENKSTSIVTGHESAVVNSVSGDVTINYSSKQ